MCVCATITARKEKGRGGIERKGKEREVIRRNCRRRRRQFALASNKINIYRNIIN